MSTIIIKFVHFTVLCLTDVQEPCQMFPGNKCYRRLESSSVRTSGKCPVCNFLLQTNGFHVRGVGPSDLRMSMKNSLPVNQKTREVLTFRLWTHGQWFCFLFCVKQYVPSVHWCYESFWGASFCCERRQRLQLLTTTQVQLWPKMAQELNPHCWMENMK